MPAMLDLFAGLGGASRAMTDRGWGVYRVEIEEKFPANHRDIRGYQPDCYFDLVWASPPCTEFARESMPWIKTGIPPSLALLYEAIRVIRTVKPAYWVIENVLGAVDHFYPVLGAYKYHVGAAFLWGHFPTVVRFPKVVSGKQGIAARAGVSRASRRSEIPYPISLALAIAVEAELDGSQPRFDFPPWYP